MTATINLSWISLVWLIAGVLVLWNAVYWSRVTRESARRGGDYSFAGALEGIACIGITFVIVIVALLFTVVLK